MVGSPAINLRICRDDLDRGTPYYDKKEDALLRARIAAERARIIAKITKGEAN